MKHRIELPDGTSISSGLITLGGDAIKSIEVVESVNQSEELTLGSTCATSLEASLIAPKGLLKVKAGTQVKLYCTQNNEPEQLVGTFTLEKPVRESGNSYKLIGFDNVAKLDKDLTQWLAELTAWPYTVTRFAQKVCDACGLELTGLPKINGSYKIPKFLGNQVTARKLMTWLGEICASFVRATPAGTIEFSWYKSNAAVQLVARPPKSATEQTYSGGSLKYADYLVMKIDQVQLKMTQDDIGVVYPVLDQANNVYPISGNYLLATESTAATQPVAEAVFNAIKDVEYIPGSVATGNTYKIHAGDIVTVTDINGVTVSLWVMQITRTGQKMSMTSSGSSSRASPSATAGEYYKSMKSRTMEIQRSIELVKIRATQTETTLKESQEEVRQQIAEVNLKAEGLSSTVQSQEQSIEGIKSQMTSFNQTAEGFELWVSNAAKNGITENGVTRVDSKFGVRIDGSALSVSREGKEMSSALDEEGLQVIRSKGKPGEEVMLKANADIVDTSNLHVHKYLVVGNSTRIEDYGASRSALFWIGGVSTFDW